MKPNLMCVALLAWMACSGAAAAHGASDEPINLNQSLVLTDKQRVTLEDQAARGSGDAALKVALFYGFVALNPVEERRWMQIAAENGNAASQYNLYHDLIDSE